MTWTADNPQVKGAYNEVTPEEAQLTGDMNKMLENDLSSVKIISKVEMKSGKRYTEWEIKSKHEDAYKALAVSQEIDTQLRTIYDHTT